MDKGWDRGTSGGTVGTGVVLMDQGWDSGAKGWTGGPYVVQSDHGAGLRDKGWDRGTRGNIPLSAPLSFAPHIFLYP